MRKKCNVDTTITFPTYVAFEAPSYVMLIHVLILIAMLLFSIQYSTLNRSFGFSFSNVFLFMVNVYTT